MRSEAPVRISSAMPSASLHRRPMSQSCSRGLRAHRNRLLFSLFVTLGRECPKSSSRLSFEPFVQVSSDHGSEGGNGLGLAIAMQAIRMHGGNISAANLAPAGLEISVRLPAAHHIALVSQPSKDQLTRSLNRTETAVTPHESRPSPFQSPASTNPYNRLTYLDRALPLPPARIGTLEAVHAVRGWLLNKFCGALLFLFRMIGVQAEMRLRITRAR